MGVVASNLMNNKPRGILQFANDGKATTGTVSITIDGWFNTTITGMFLNVELFGWNTGDTAPTLSLGGGTADSAVYNTTTLGGAMNLLGGTGVAIAASGFTASTWATKTVTASLDLGTGYDYYAWRVGVVGADGPSDEARFDNITVVPEPSSMALLGLMLRRRR